MSIKINHKTKSFIAGAIMTSALCSGVVLAAANTNLQEISPQQVENTIASGVDMRTLEIEPMTEPAEEVIAKPKAEDIYRLAELAEKSEVAKLSSASPWLIGELIMQGEFGEGDEIKKRVEKEGYNYEEAQKYVKKSTPDNFEKTKSNKVVNQVSNAAGGSSIAEEDVQSKKSVVIKAYPHKEFKSYMRWTALGPNTTQGKFSAKATPDPETAIMKYNGRYLVALGFAYADHVGQEIDIVMESGQVIPAVVGDFKATEHTDKYKSAQRWDGSVVEFIVSSNAAAAKATNGTGSYNSIFPGKVKEFRK